MAMEYVEYMCTQNQAVRVRTKYGFQKQNGSIQEDLPLKSNVIKVNAEEVSLGMDGIDRNA